MARRYYRRKRRTFRSRRKRYPYRGRYRRNWSSKMVTKRSLYRTL